MNDLKKKISKKKIILWLVLLVVVVASVIAFMIYQAGPGRGRQAALKIIPDNVDLQIKNFHYTEVGDANWKWEIRADTAKYLKKENTAHFDRVEIKIIRTDGKQLVITGEKGVLHTDTKDATVSGDVHVKIDEEGLVKTEHLEYLDAKKRVQTSDAVVFTTPRLQVKGTGMTFVMDEQKITLQQNVQAVYTR